MCRVCDSSCQAATYSPTHPSHLCYTRCHANHTSLQDASFRDQLGAALATSPPAILMGVGITDPGVAAWLAGAAGALPTSLFWESDPVLVTRMDGYSPATAGPLAQVG